MSRKCPMCGKEAKTKAGLAGHLMMQHEIEGRKAHQIANEVIAKEKEEEEKVGSGKW